MFEWISDSNEHAYLSSPTWIHIRAYLTQRFRAELDDCPADATRHRILPIFTEGLKLSPRKISHCDGAFHGRWPVDEPEREVVCVSSVDNAFEQMFD